MDQSVLFRNNKHFLRYFCVARGVQLKSLIQHSSKQELKTICEVLLNVLHGNINTNLDTQRRVDLRKTLTSKSVPTERKRRILVSSTVYRLYVKRLLCSLQV
jgi:hypothetical protein